MKNIYANTRILDKNAVLKYALSDEILMENAANALERAVERVAVGNSVITIIVGTGDNGADGLSLARHLAGKYSVRIFMPNPPKTELGKLQLERVKALEVAFVEKLLPCDIVVDCLFGSGFHGEIDSATSEIIAQMNRISRVKIACDIPSGIDGNGNVGNVAFKADMTIAMGALKLAYFSDRAKDFVGEIVEANLGISSAYYQAPTPYKLLEKSDLRLPRRADSNTHKGNFGHCCVISGEKEGACVLSALSAFAFGAGLVSIIGEVKNPPYHIMSAKSLPNNCRAIAFGMGLGEKKDKYSFDFIGKIPAVLDADMFYSADLPRMLDKGNLILTPHLKEFASLLKILNFGIFDTRTIANNRIDLVGQFSEKYPEIVLVLKGANMIIAHKSEIFINTLGRNNLSKGGSGDILSGLIASLIAQGYSLRDAAINATLALALASQNIKTSYGLEPLGLIDEIKALESRI